MKIDVSLDKDIATQWVEASRSGSEIVVSSVASGFQGHLGAAAGLILMSWLRILCRISLQPLQPPRIYCLSYSIECVGGNIL